MPISTGEQLKSALFGVFYFQECPYLWQYILGFGTLAITILGIYLTTYYKDRPENAGTNIGGGGGLIVLTFSAAANVGYAVFPRIFGLNGWDILFPQVIATLVAMMIIVGTIRWQDIFSKKAFKIFRPAFASRLLTSAFYFQINSMVWRWLYPPQFNVVIATLGGLFILHEKKTSMQEWFILAGLVLVVVGAVMIGVTKRGGPNYLFKSTDILVSGDYIHRDP